MPTVTNAINISINAQIALPGVGSAAGASALSYNSTTGVYYDAVVLVASGSWNALSIGGVTSSTAQFIYVRNTDATNYVTVSTDSGGANPFTRLLPGEQMLVPYNPSSTYYVEAHTAACLCLVVVFDA